MKGDVLHQRRGGIVRSRLRPLGILQKTIIEVLGGNPLTLPTRPSKLT